MPLNPSAKFRAVIYVLTAIGTPVVAYLNAKGYIGALEVTLWSAEVTAATGLAAINTAGRTQANVSVDAPADVAVTLDAAAEH